MSTIPSTHAWLMSSKRSALLLSIALSMFIVCMLVLALSGSAQAAPAVTCTVPSGSYATIQSAVNDANCTTINIAAGTYTEAISITRSVTLQGVLSATTMISGTGSNRVITVNGLGNSINVTINDLRVTRGQAGDDIPVATLGRAGGGILAANGATLYLNDLTVDGNFANTGVNSANRNGFGGGIAVYNASLHGQNLYVPGNTASTGRSGFGGGIAIVSATAYLTNNLIYSNVAQPSANFLGQGGGLYAAGVTGSGKAVLYMKGNKVYSNTAYSAAQSAAGNGGGLYVGETQDTRITLSDNTWAWNVARSSSANPGDGNGGGVAVVTLNAQAVVNLIGDRFIYNIANASNGTTNTDDAKGGAIFIDTNFSAGPGFNITGTLNGVTMEYNIAKSGTGDAVGQGGGLFGGEALLSYNDGGILNNVAAVTGSGQGGGIRLSGSPLTANGLTVLNNTVRQSGGAATFLQGGGLHTSGAGTDLTLTNSILAGNSASTGSGAELYINYSGGSNETARIVHVTLADPTLNADEAIFYTGGAANRVYITNTIVASHSVGVQNSGATGTLLANYVLYFGNTSNTVGSVTGNVGNVSGNPLFVNPPGGDYHIQETSPAVGAGINANLQYDIDGDDREAEPGYDIGADEVVSTAYIYLPIVLGNWP
jgi:hypothetical protein